MGWGLSRLALQVATVRQGMALLSRLHLSKGQRHHIVCCRRVNLPAPALRNSGMNLINENCRAVPFGLKQETTSAISETLGAYGYKRRTTARIVGVFALLGILVAATQSNAQPWTQVQGRLIGIGYYGPSPVGGVVLTLFNGQLGRSTQSVSRPDGTFSFRNIPLGWYNVELWFPNNPYPHTVRVAVNQMPVSNIGTIQLDMRTGPQGPRGIGGIPGRGGWVQAGY
jgi:hypothetical protein